MRWWNALGGCMGIALISACVPGQGVFACGEDAACVANGIGGQCQPTGYCSFPDPACDSEQRYGEHAGGGLSGTCVEEGSQTSSDSSTTTEVSMTTGDILTTDITTTSATTDYYDSSTSNDTSSSSWVGPMTTFSTFGSTTYDDTSSGGESTSTGGEPIIPPACVDVSFGDALKAGSIQPDPTNQGDDYPASCLQGNAPDVVFFWVAPVAGIYEFYAEAPQGVDVVGSLWSACDGVEVACDDDGGEAVDSRIVREVYPGEEFIWVVNAYGSIANGFSVYIRPVAE